MYLMNLQTVATACKSTSWCVHAQVKELFDSEAIPTLTKAEFSALTSDEANLLALVLSDSLSSGKSITAVSA